MAATQWVDICHDIGAAAGFMRIRIQRFTLNAHLGHGDALVGYPVPGQPGQKFDLSCVPVPLLQTTLTFAALAGTADLSPFNDSRESGFKVATVLGAWVVFAWYGNPAPAIVFTRPADAPASTGTIGVTAGGSPFMLDAVDLYSSVTPIPYVLTGVMDGRTVFTVTGTEPSTYGSFVRVANPRSADVIDALVISLSNPATPCCSNPMGLDNIVLKH